MQLRKIDDFLLYLVYAMCMDAKSKMRLIIAKYLEALFRCLTISFLPALLHTHTYTHKIISN